MLPQRQYLNDDADAESQMNLAALAAARAGSVSTSVLLFSTTPTGRGMALVNSATAGTRITLTRAGVYLALLTVTVPASGDLEIGIGRNIAATFAVDPDLAAAGVLATQRLTAPASTSLGGSISALLLVTRAQAAAGVVVAPLASDAGGSAPAAGDIVAANTTFSLSRIASMIT